MFNKRNPDVVTVLLFSFKCPQSAFFVWLCRFRDHLCVVKASTGQVRVVFMSGLLRYKLFNNDRDIFTGEPWFFVFFCFFLHLLHFVSYQLRSCRPPSVLHSWAREAAHRLVLQMSRAALLAVLVFLITMTLMQVCAFISQQHSFTRLCETRAEGFLVNAF